MRSRSAGPAGRGAPLARLPGLPAALLCVLLGGLLGGLLVGCSDAPSSSSGPTGPAPSTPGRPTAAASPTAGGAPAPTSGSTTAVAEPAPPYQVSDGRPRRALLTVPALGIEGLVVVPYRGWTDDAPGTAIQDRGLAASPHGPRGGTGPGGVGSYQVTAHRLSSTRAFERLPELRRGDRVHVVAGGTRWTYRIVSTLWTSFRSAESLRRQRAAVPGRPGVAPTRAMVLLSTCATPEDHAAGNFWSDRFGNPEHRIDKVGVLVRSGPA